MARKPVWARKLESEAIPKKAPLIAEPYKLNDGEWGAWVRGHVNPGDEVLRVRASGLSSREVVTKVIIPAGLKGPKALVRTVAIKVCEPVEPKDRPGPRVKRTR